MRKVRAALVEKALEVLTSAPLLTPTENIISENMPRPEVSDTWYQLWFKPGAPRVFTLGSGGLDELTGVLLVNGHIPLDEGNAKGLEVAGTMRTVFTAGLRLIFEGQGVEVLNCGVNLGRIVDTWYRADVSITFRAHLTRGVA